MARSNQGCLCRVPLAETAMPAFARTDESLKWLADHGCDLDTDHLGRLSISMEDAYRLRREADEQARKSAEELAERNAKLQRQISEAHAKRQRVYSEAYTKAVGQGLQPSMAMERARQAVEHAERNMDPVLKSQVPSHIEIPQVYPRGVGQVTSQPEYDPDDSWRSAS